MTIQIEYSTDYSSAVITFDSSDSLSHIQEAIQSISQDTGHLHFNYRKTRLNDFSESLSSIFSAIPEHITYLNLDSHYLTAKHADALKVLTLKANLLHINLYNNPIGDTGALALASSNTDKIYYFSDSIIGEKGAKKLAENPHTAAFIYQTCRLDIDFTPPEFNVLIESNYQTLLRLLKEKSSLQEKSIQKPIQQLISKIERTKKQDSARTAELNLILGDTVSLLTNKITPKHYQDSSQKMQNASSLALKILGGFMMALSVLIVAKLIVLTAPVSLPLLATSAVCTVVGVSFFAKGSQKSLVKEQDNLALELLDNINKKQSVI